MTVPLLLEHFDELISTPEDVEKLNNFILDLAVRGSLVAQDSTDEPVHKLLQKNTLEDKDKNKEAQSSKDDKIPPLKEDDRPYVLPKGWEWARIGSIAFVTKLAGFEFTKYVSYDPAGDIPVIKGENVSKQGFRKTKFSYVKSESVKHLTRSHLQGDDLLMGFVGSVGQVARVPMDQQYFLGPNVALIRFDSRIVSPAYAELFFRSPIGFRLATSLSKATAQHSISMTQIRLTPFAIPPLAEQQRIAARVEELFAQTRLLDEQLAHSRTELDRLNESALAHLLASETPEEFNERWCFITEHFDLLTSAPEHIAPLRQSILELAVRGNLTRRDAGDASAKELLQRIRANNANSLTPVSENEMMFEIPKEWEWARLEEVADILMGQSPPGTSYNENGDGVPLINGPVEFGNGSLAKTKKTKFTTSPTKMCKEGDLLICVRGSTTGRTNLSGFDACIGRGVAAIRSKFDYQDYLNYFMIYYRDSFYRLGTGSTFPSVSSDKIQVIPVPFPSLAEQERIVKRVEQLLGWCDALEAQLKSAEEEHGRLVESVLARVGG